MKRNNKLFTFTIFVVVVCFFSGCETLRPFAGGAARGLGALIVLPFKILGAAVGVAKKVPWWMWL